MKNFLYLLLLLAAFPTAIFLSRLCKEEIKNWRKRLGIISIIGLVLVILISLTPFVYKLPIIISLIFIITTNLTIIWISYRS